VVFIATYGPIPATTDMGERVRRHRAERTTHGAARGPADIVQALADLRRTLRAVIDSIVLWLADRVDQDDASLIARGSAS